MKHKILDLPMQENDADAETIREYLHALLSTLWYEGDGFSGKRPFGNSGWRLELYTALVKAGAVLGKLDEDGCLDDVDSDEAWAMIDCAIDYLCRGEG